MKAHTHNLKYSNQKESRAQGTTPSTSQTTHALSACVGLHALSTCHSAADLSVFLAPT
jgi:hypothetical protein